jgi:DNA-binding LytR/AlgR family response regulator
LESQRDYVQIATIAKQIKTRHTLQYFEELLPKKQFVRIHRSFIIAVAKIQSVSENRVEAGGKELMIGGNYKKAIFDKLNIR